MPALLFFKTHVKGHVRKLKTGKVVRVREHEDKRTKADHNLKVMQIRDQDHLHATLKELSLKEGGAWTFVVMPFSHEVRFRQFKSPSSVPDIYHDQSHNRIGYKGEVVPFTNAARIREQNRGLGRGE